MRTVRRARKLALSLCWWVHAHALQLLVHTLAAPLAACLACMLYYAELYLGGGGGGGHLKGHEYEHSGAVVQ
jgi:hypothetical protein